MNRKWFLKGALAGLALSLSVTAGADQQTYTVLKAHQLDPGANKEGTVFTFPAVTIGSTNGVESVNYASVKTGTDLSKANWADDSGNAAVAYVVKITKPWSKNKAGEVTLLSMKIGAKYGFGGGLTIPEFVWAHDEERSGDEAFPSYKVTAIADTVLKFLTKVDGEINGGSSNYYTNLTAGKFANIYLSPLMPKVLGSGKIKTYGLLKGEGDPTTGDYASFGIVHVDPTWAVLESNTTVKEGPNFYDPKKVQVEGAESVVRDLQFGLGGDNRDLEVSKADLDAISKFIASATPVTKADDLGSKKDNKGKLVKKSTAQLRIGGNLKDKLPNKYLTLGKELFTVDSLAWRFATIAFGNEVAGNFNDAAFAAIQPIHKLVDLLEDEKHQQPDFIAIDLSNVKLSTDKETVFDLKGDGLFEGLTIGVVEDATTTGGLALPKGLTAIGNKWFKDATIHALGAIATYDEDEGEYTIEADNLGSSLISIGDEAFRNGFIGNGDEFLANVKGTDLAYNNDGSFTDASKPLTIGKSAFQGFRFDEYPAVEDVKVAQLDLSAFQRAIAIGDSAFADITYPHLYAAVKEEGSLLDVIKNLDDSEAEVYFFPAINFSALKHVQTLGKGIFANDHIYIAATDIKNTELGEGKKAINLPFEHLISAPADVFKSAAFITGGLSHPAAPAVTADDESIYFEDLDTIPFHAFTFSENIAPGAEINKAAFPEDTIYVHFTTFEKWKYALTGSKLVSDYGFKGATFENGKDRNDELVKIVTGSTGAIANWKQSGEYEITYAFAHNSRARTISFYNAYQAAKRWYTIEGPESAKIAAPGFLTDGKKEITEAFAEDGIVLDPFTPAGLYVIKVYNLDKEIGTSSNQNLTYILRILPADLARYKAEPVSLGYVGKENIVEALKHKFPNGLYFNIKNEYEEIEDLHHEAAEVKVYEEAALELKAGDEPSTSVLVVKGLGSYVNELPIELSYTARDLKDVTFDIAPVDFKIGEKEFKIPGDLKFTVIEGDTLYTLSVPQAKEGDEEDATSIAIEYKGAIGKPGIVPITLAGHSELTGTKETSYEIKANWTDYAAFPTTGSDYKVSGLPKTFSGKALEGLNSLVKPFILEAGQYKVVATLETSETYKTSKEVEEAAVEEIYAAAKYDLYILPDGDLKAKYTDAAFIGFYEIDKLSFEDFKDAFIVGKDEEGAFTLSVDQSIYADDFGAILAATGDTFTVTIAEKAESSIDGLPSNPFKFAIPTAEPTALEATNLHFDGVLYIVVGQTKDLNDYIKAKNKDAAIDFKSFISYISDEPEKLAIEGSILTAVDKWNGEVTATYTKGSKTIKVTFPVKAVESEDKIPTPPTSVESIVKGAKSVAFAGGELILKGFGGSIATVYGLNGGVVASFVVGSDDASFGLGLSKGFYLVKVGSSVTKFIVK